MSNTMNPAAPHHLPMFVTAPGQTDVLFNVMAIFLVVMVLALVVFYFRLHALPERLAHKGQKLQLEIVAVLGLISLFTHNHIFWIAGLLLALIPIPDFSTPLGRMADSLATMAGRRKRDQNVDVASEPAGADMAAPPEMTVADRRPLVESTEVAALVGNAPGTRQRTASKERA
jgi:hypothetical protein